MQVQIDICLTEVGAQVLHAHGIDPESYRPAYDGESIGLDLYNAGPEIVFHGRNKWVAFGEQKMFIPAGIKIKLPKGSVALIKERGSISDTGLVVRGGVIDPGFTGEIFVELVNVGEREIRVTPGAKLPVQLIVVPCYTNFRVVSNLEYLGITTGSIRKAGNLGSSNEDNTEKRIDDTIE